MAETSLSPPPGRRQLTDQRGFVVDHWWRWFEQLWRRVGAANAMPIGDLEPLVMQLAAEALLTASPGADVSRLQGRIDDVERQLGMMEPATSLALARRLHALERQDEPSPWAVLARIGHELRTREAIALFH